MHSRSRIDFKDDATTWTLALVKKQVDLILRLNHSFKRAIKPKPLTTADLILVPITLFQLPEERLGVVNAIKNYEISYYLYKKGDYRDAYLSLHLAAEHLVKLILIKSKYAYNAKYLDPLPSNPDPKGNEANYSHDLKFIFHYLVGLITDFSTVVRVSDILRAMALRKVHSDWAKTRYIVDPNDVALSAQYKVDYRTLRKGFIKFYNSLKRKGLLK